MPWTVDGTPHGELEMDNSGSPVGIRWGSSASFESSSLAEVFCLSRAPVS